MLAGPFAASRIVGVFIETVWRYTMPRLFLLRVVIAAAVSPTQ
jgi:hypothetical protein